MGFFIIGIWEWAVALKSYVGFLIKSDLCRKRHRHLTEDAGAFLLECSGNQLNNSSSFCWSVPSLAYGSASNCRKLCLMSFVSSLKPRMYESAMWIDDFGRCQPIHLLLKNVAQAFFGVRELLLHLLALIQPLDDFRDIKARFHIEVNYVFFIA